MKRSLHALALLSLAACGGTTAHPAPEPTASTAPRAAPAIADAGTTVATTEPAVPAAPHESPPEPGPRRDIHFPAIARSTLPNGLEVNVVEYHTLPIVHLRLVARTAGSDADPAEIPGLASFTGDMLKEGTRAHTSAQIAESIDFVGGSLAITTTPDSTTIAVAVLRDYVETALGVIAELATEPTFPQAEIDKLRRRELDRLTQSQQDPTWLSRREFYAAAYGAHHPYAHLDATPASLRRITRNDLVAFHRARFVAGSMYLAVVGDVAPATFDPLVARTLGRLRRGTAPAIRFPEPPARTTRQVILVDRPNSAQAAIRIGDLSLRRNSEDYVPLAVANQVLGGDAASRLFMELRERRSLTYGAYSRVAAGVDVGTFQALGSVRTPVTAEALAAFFEQLERIVHEAPPADELGQARDYLIDQFPLAISTAGDLAGLLVDLRLYGLPDTYWDTYRTRIASVSAPQALAAAQRYVHPDTAVVVVVGSADAFQEALQHFGPVRVVNTAGDTVRELPAHP